MIFDAYTDGSYSSKTRNGGWAFIAISTDIFFKGKPLRFQAWGGEKESRIGRLEYVALAELLTVLPLGCTVRIYIDRQETLLGACEKEGKFKFGRILKAKNRGWKGVSGKVWQNVSICKRVLGLLEKHVDAGTQMYFYWVKSHSGNVCNDEVDALAKLGAETCAVYNAAVD